MPSLTSATSSDAIKPSSTVSHSFLWTPELRQAFKAGIKVAAYKRKKEILQAKKDADAAASALKAATRNRTYVTKMLSLPKLVFTDQVSLLPLFLAAGTPVNTRSLSASP